MNKQLILMTAAVFFTFAAWAQRAPQGINYQAIARDAGGQVLASKTISLQISLFEGETKSKSVYSEIHRIQTNELGLFNLLVGNGEVESGDFEEIPWQTMDVWMELALDETGGKNFVPIHASRLMTVPYAFHAATAGELRGGQENTGAEKTAAFWKANGNDMTTPGPHYLGTIDSKDLVIKTGGIERMRIGSSGDVNVNNTLNVGTDANVGRNVNIGQDLDVNRDANIDRDLTVWGIARFNNTTQSATKDNGAVIIEGGTGIEKNLNVGGHTEIDGTLGVDGITSLKNVTESTNKDDGALIVEGGTGIEKNLNVGGSTAINGNFALDGIMNLNNLTQSTTKDNGALIVEGGVGIEKNVNIGGNTEVDGTLGVDGITTLKNTTESTTKDNGALVVEGGAGIEKNLNVGGNTRVTGGLTITGTTTLNNSLTVAGQTFLNNTLNVSGFTNINNGFRATQNSTFNQSLAVGQDLSVGGKITLLTSIMGPDNDPLSYPVYISGGNQGIYIGINANRSNSNNFVTFADGDGIQGRIEGETMSELTNSRKYERETAVFALNISGLTADVAALSAEAVTVAAQVITAAEVASVTAQAAAAAVMLAAYIVQRDNYNVEVTGNVGVAYESGSGDYAEWLERSAPEIDLEYGQIVGVKGGKISLSTAEADHYMVVSMSPIVLGNMPRPNEETRYEKVAFMGQVPVQVVGAVAVGDYIIPSGNNDGYGLAVHPADMKLGDYARIVGVAWQAASDGPVNYVNVAVGINSNDLTRKMEELQRQQTLTSQKVDNILAFLEGKATLQTREALPPTAMSAFTANTAQPQTSSEKVLSDEVFDQVIATNQHKINLFYTELKANLANRGINITDYPELIAIFNNPVEQLKKLRRDPEMKTQWGRFDQKLLAGK